MNLLAQLDSFSNNQKIISYNQSTSDIINAILKQHNKSFSDYDKLYYFFDQGTYVATAKKVFSYLKNNIKYKIEPDNLQTVKTPSAILATGKTTGSDCKNYSLFFAGIMDAYRRNTGENFELCYRFASYDGSNIPEHVFVVINPGTDNEIWCDAVLSYFNEKKEPNYYKDKKIKNMALMALSGINKQPQINGVLDVVQSGASLVPGGESVSALIGLVSSLFAGHSDSYILDHAIIDNDWNKAMGVFLSWYQQVGFDITKKPWRGTGTDQGVSKEVPQPYISIPRFEWMPLVWQQTRNVEFGNLINEAIKQGKLNSKYFINSKGEMAPESSILTNLFGGGKTTPGAPGASGGISTTMLIGGVAAAGLIAFLIFKKK
jgi:hypothetical protein